MKKIIGLVALSVVFMLSGCVVRTYQMTRDRIDQDLSGNRGYLKGQAPQVDESKERVGTRTTQVVEVELVSPFKSKKSKKAREQKQSAEPSFYDDQEYVSEPLSGEKMETLPAGGYKEYKIEKNDTLQKISQKFYGTTRKWTDIYNVNKDVLKGPDKVRVGQVIKIPVEGMKETRENLK